MNNFFKEMIKEILSSDTYKEKQDENNRVDDIADFEFKNLYKKIIDHVAVRIFCESIESEIIFKAFMKLPRMQRLIVVFNILLEYDEADIAKMADSTTESIYSQKSKALRYFRSALGLKED